MKTKIFFTFLTFTIALFTNAQVNKGVVMYDAFVSSDNPQAASWVEQMENSSLTLYFNTNNIRSEMNMGDFMSIQSISDKTKDSTLLLFDSMMGRYAMAIDHKEAKEETDENDRMARQNQPLVPDDAKLDFTEETKKILGYACKKVIVSTEEGESIIWYTEEIVPEYRGGQYLSERIEGLPLEIETKFGGMDVKLEAYQFKAKLKKEEQLFSYTLPKGFELKTAEELQMMQRGGAR